MSNPDVSEELKAELVKIGLQALKTLNATPTQIPGWHYTEETQMRSIIEAIAPRLKAEGLREGMKEAAIAWTVCASIHREYAKRRDPLFKTRQADFVKAADKARADALSP